MPRVSVIIPTFNRYPFLSQALDQLARQSLAKEQFEVIVVDDGSSDDTHLVGREVMPVQLRYVWQENRGDAAARNTGVEHAEADLLVFLDDDVLVAPHYLEYLLAAHADRSHRVVVGTERLWLADQLPPPIAVSHLETDRLLTLPFPEVCSNNMSIRRDGYLELGMMHGLDFPGSSMWCDTDFAFRAHKAGYSFWRSELAVAWHRDYTMRSLASQTRRAEESSFRVVALLRKHPDLLPYLPMFEDKTPIDWRRDPPRLVARKVARPFTSSRGLLLLLERFERMLPEDALPPLVTALHRWIIGGHVYRGFRRGLQEIGELSSTDSSSVGSGSESAEDMRAERTSDASTSNGPVR